MLRHRHLSDAAEIQINQLNLLEQVIIFQKLTNAFQFNVSTVLFLELRAELQYR